MAEEQKVVLVSNREGKLGLKKKNGTSVWGWKGAKMQLLQTPKSTALEFTSVIHQP